MESALFSWTGWDQHDTFCFAFYNCIVKAPFGPFKAGDLLKYLTLDYEAGQIRVWRTKTDEEPTWEGRMRLEVLT